MVYYTLAIFTLTLPLPFICYSLSIQRRLKGVQRQFESLTVGHLSVASRLYSSYDGTVHILKLTYKTGSAISGAKVNANRL